MFRTGIGCAFCIQRGRKRSLLIRETVCLHWYNCRSIKNPQATGTESSVPHLRVLIAHDVCAPHPKNQVRRPNPGNLRIILTSFQEKVNIIEVHICLIIYYIFPDLSTSPSACQPFIRQAVQLESRLAVWLTCCLAVLIAMEPPALKAGMCKDHNNRQQALRRPKILHRT